MSPELTIAGSGIQAIAQMTPQVREAIRRVDKVLYLVAEPFTARYVEELNPNAESLQGLYRQREPRERAYARMVARILECLDASDVCVVFYGHPTVLVAPARDAVRKARAVGHTTRVLPGISAEDCLYADLLLDPGTQGMQSYEATQFLLYTKAFDTSTPLVLWQVGVLGDLCYNPAHSDSRTQVLADYLAPFYGLRHGVILYTASSHPAFDAVATQLLLSELGDAIVTAASTLVVPPSRLPLPNPAMQCQLGLSRVAPSDQFADNEH